MPHSISGLTPAEKELNHFRRRTAGRRSRLLAGPAPGEEHLRISAAGEQLFLVFKVVYMIRMPAHLLQMARPDLQGHFFAVGVHNDDVHSASLLSPVLCRGVRPPT